MMVLGWIGGITAIIEAANTMIAQLVPEEEHRMRCPIGWPIFMSCCVSENHVADHIGAEECD